MSKVERTLHWHFALLTIFCGAILGNDSQTSGLAGIALIAAVTSMILVDRLRWIWLPPPVAYLLMLLASVHSMLRFFNSGDGRQIGSVAILLVLVQAILLFQRKTRRIYEQLTVFCLLQLIVSAVLNDALSYGLLLIPISLLLLSALCHLQAWHPLERTRSHRAFSVREQDSEIDSRAWNRLLRSAAIGWLGVFFFTIVSFYLLPRSKAMQPRTSGNGKVGFSDTVTLDQIGKLGDNPAIAMNVHLTNARTNKPYRVDDQFYLRGVVLDAYSRKPRGSAEWTSSSSGPFRVLQDVPNEYFNFDRKLDGYDSVNVSIEMLAQANSNLFSIVPYHKTIESDALKHYVGKWLLRESGLTSDSPTTKLTRYGFGTHAFYRNRQTPWLRPFANPYLTPGDHSDLNVIELRFMQRFNPHEMPTVEKLALEIVDRIPKDERRPYHVVQSLERYLKTSDQFAYSRTLDMPVTRGVDPIEMFVSTHRTGNCQHFASALAMMLRSQGFPCRVVVGYLGHEYNSLGQFYVIRQQDAHAWVEVYLAFDQIPGNVTIPGQLNKDGAGAWLRLDPTPAERRDDAGQVGQAMDLAQSLWKSYVVEMNDRRQSESIFSIFGESTGEFSFWERMQMTLTRIRAGQLGEGQLTLNRILSWQAAIATMMVCLVGVVAWQFYGWLNRRLRWAKRKKSTIHPSSAISYFASLVKMLSIGGTRAVGQTPGNWTVNVTNDLIERGVPLPKQAVEFIVNRYYLALYGGQQILSDEDEVRIAASLDEIRHAFHNKAKS